MTTRRSSQDIPPVPRNSGGNSEAICKTPKHRAQHTGDDDDDGAEETPQHIHSRSAQAARSVHRPGVHTPSNFTYAKKTVTLQAGESARWRSIAAQTPPRSGAPTRATRRGGSAKLRDRFFSHYRWNGATLPSRHCRRAYRDDVKVVWRAAVRPYGYLCPVPWRSSRPRYFLCFTQPSSWRT